MIRDLFLHTKVSGIVLELYLLLRRSGIHPYFGDYAAIQAVTNDAEDVIAQLIFVLLRLHRQ